jgi:membrane associated rhomboid family serine protease
VIARPTLPGSAKSPLPFATLALALASAIVFLVLQPRDRALQAAAVSYYVDSGLAAIELPRYREFLQRSTDSDAVARLSRLERSTGRNPAKPADPAAAVRALQSDADFENGLRAGKYLLPTDPIFASWERDRRRFDELASMALEQRFGLNESAWSEPWRLVTHAFLHSSLATWLSNLVFLLLLGPFVEAAAGPAMLLLCFLGASAFTGSVHVLVIGSPKLGDWGAMAALAGLLATVFGARAIPARLALGDRRLPIPGFSALLLLAGAEALRWAWGAFASVDLLADVSGLAFGALLTAMFRLRDGRRVRQLLPAQPDDQTQWPKESSLVRQAREAATRLDTRRATQLFKEVVDLEPQRIEHLCAYLNVALLGPDETNLQDAALRLLWLRSKSQSEDMRKAFLVMTQPKVLAVLPIDEHLRLARRLVRIREDAAALKVLDAILTDDHLRQLYGRQLADCLLGIYTGYVRRRLTTLADTIRSRLVKYFQAPDQIGGVPPATRPPTTLFTSSPQPTRSYRSTRS